MKSFQQQYTGTDYHASAACLVLGSVFCPAILPLSRPFGSDSILLALGVSSASLALAWAS